MLIKAYGVIILWWHRSGRTGCQKKYRAHQEGNRYGFQNCDACEGYGENFGSRRQYVIGGCWCSALVEHIGLIHQQIAHNLYAEYLIECL